MTFIKGQGRIAGRQKGTPNKTTSNLKATIQNIVERQFETLESDLEELEGRDKINFVLKLIEYVLPKQRETKIDFNSLSDEEIDELINRLKTPENES
jgi:hypothetical protein